MWRLSSTIPGNLGSKTSEGTNRLIKQGAKLVTSVEDILEELKITTGGQRPPSPPTEEELSRLSEREKDLFELISDEPHHIDRIAGEASVTVSDALTVLLSLELKGLVRQLSGKMFVRA